jgi:hypothetical protein
VHPEDVAACPVEPCQHEDLVVGAEVADRVADALLEDEPRLRRTLVPLLRRVACVRER